ncbi:MAG: M1 family metallopeptidase [Olleya sp.]
MKQLLLILFTFFSFTVEAQQTDVVDFKTINTRLVLMPDSTKVSGKVKCSFEILNNTDSIYLDAINIKFTDVLLNGNTVEVRNDLKKIWLKSNFKKNETYNLSFKYVAYPKKAMYFVKRNEDWQIWTQGQGKYTSNWLPSIDDMNDKIEFDLSVVNSSNLKVVANGELIKREVSGSISQLHFNMKNPMSSYLVALVAGKYDVKYETSKSGIPIQLYYYPEDSAKVEPTYRYTKQMFDFLEDEIGVPYPWQNYKQVPVKDFLYSGMENTSCTIFSDDFMIDDTSFIDKNYVNVNAHELAHQWFGDFVTAKSSQHHWLQEGFATYYALLAERNIFGDDYYYHKLYEYYQELIEQDEAGESTALLNPKSSSTTFYKKGAWVLHVLREQVGNKAFKTAVKSYLEKQAFKNVETTDFISEVEKTSGQDLTNFVNKWLMSDILLENEMIAALEVNETISFLLTMKNNPYLSYRKDNDDNYIPSSLATKLPDGYYPMQVAILEEAFEKPDYPTFNDLIVDAFQSDNVKLRQAIASNLIKIPSELKTDYETLLDDNSYITKEIALYNLWANFPQQRNAYLEKTKTVFGFNDYNVRLLWLTLAIATPEYQQENKEDFYNEMVGYTASFHPFSRRQNAFSYLDNLGLFNEIALENLIEASHHHNWRFKSFAQQLLNSLSENEQYKSIISNLQDNQKE